MEKSVLIVVEKTFAKNNLAFHENNEKIYQKINRNFFRSNWNDCEFDSITQEHVLRIQGGEIQNHYFRH